jgi:diguanylate cyclase (GGDEF)-like protein
MPNSISGRITLNLVAGILLTVLTVLGAIWWMAGKHNEASAVSTHTMVVGGVEAMTKRLQTITNDYSWWEEAHDAFVRQDSEWIENNIGTGITETEIADLLAIVAPDGEVAYAWMIAEDDTVETLLPPQTVTSVRRLLDGVPVGRLAAKSAYIDTPKGPMLLSASRVTPVSRVDNVEAADLPLLLMAIYLSEERLLELGKTYLIGDLRFATSLDGVDTETHDNEPISDIDGRPLGQFVWTPPQPGRALLASVALPIGVALSLFCGIALLTAFRARTMAVALSSSEQQATAASRTDSLTGLINRHGFNQLTEAIDANKGEGNPPGIIYLDINGFKAVNDSIGHHGGDDLVKALAGRFSSLLPPESALARVGGDEFAVLLTGRNVMDMVSGVAAALAHSLDRPFSIGGFEFHVSAAVGYAFAERQGIDADELLRRADLAMYQAKAGAERDPVAYHPAMETGALEKKQVETALRRALELGELQVFYQPIVRASDLTIVALEALARWQSPEMGVVPPTIFIPIAEETGLIHDLGRYVLERVCTDRALWPSVTTSINVSPVQLRDPNFADDALAILQRFGLRAETFELELTEGILVSNPTIAKRRLGRLKELGFQLSLDDFGTGFSSIGYLRQFPFDKLKVDRSFVREIGLNPTANALVQALVSLGDAMELDVVAEGIENEEQLNLLRLVQCEYIQGYYVSKAIPAAEITELFLAAGANAPRFSNGSAVRQIKATAAA